MPKAWNKKDERQYKAVLKSCLKKDGRKTKACKSLAARVVNKRRSKEGRTVTGSFEIGKKKVKPNAPTLRKGSKIQFKFKRKWINATFVKKAQKGPCFVAKITDNRVRFERALICGLPVRRAK